MAEKYVDKIKSWKTKKNKLFYILDVDVLGKKFIKSFTSL